MRSIKSMCKWCKSSLNFCFKTLLMHGLAQCLVFENNGKLPNRTILKETIVEALKKAESLGYRSFSTEANQKIARVLKEFLSTIIRTIYCQDLNELRVIRIVADNSIVTKINNIHAS